METSLPATNGQSKPGLANQWIQNFKIIQQLYVEPFILLYMFGYSLSAMAVSQLVQDKLCRVDYDQSAEFCISINSADFDHGGETIKSNIITGGAYITLYRTLLSTLPCIIWVIFLGPWSDTYVNGRKIIMIAGASAAAIESLVLIINAAVFQASAYFVLLAFIPSAFSGGIIATLMSVYAYCSATSDKETRSTRFAILEICFWIAQPIGSFIGGQILGNGDQHTHYQLYNYIPVFVVSCCAQIAAIIWAILVINENSVSKNGDLITQVNSTTFEPATIQTNPAEMNNFVHTSINGSNDARISPIPPNRNDPDLLVFSNDQESLIFSDSNISYISFTRINFNFQKYCSQFRGLFRMSNVSQLWITVTKKRKYSGRGQIWALFFSTAILMLAYLNTAFILWPYVEKLYSWPPKYYSNVTSGVAVGTLLLMGLILLTFIRAFKFGDMRLAMFGVVSLISQCILRGSWQHELGLYLSFVMGCFAPLSFIGLRSRLSKIIDDDERGKLFALLAIVEAVTPGIASLFYSTIFSASIDIYPGLAFQLAAFILLIPLLCIIFIDVRCTHDYDRPQSVALN